jgi:MarR family transcriptional regulator, organic hydroperoxide resistance regulator
MADAGSNDERFSLWWLFMQTRQVLYQARQKELSDYGISIAEEAVLLAIHACGENATVGEISRRVMRKPHSSSEIISKMEKSGLVIRVHDKNGRGRVKVAMTAKGNKVYQRSLQRDSIWEIMSSLSSDESKQFTNVLKKLRGKAVSTIASNNLPPLL